MLGRERFLAIKKLARDIREDNEKLFMALAKEKTEDAIKEKNEFIESVIDNMDIAFSDGEKGNEERQIFRANVLIPDDLEFYADYSKDKNIRNLMNKYAVSIDDIMSKITELNLYGKYIEEFNDEEESQDELSFVDEMIKMSPKEAVDLLNEIDNLSDTIDDLDFEDNELKPDPSLLTPEVISDEKETEDTFDDITEVVSGFIDNYSDIQKSLDDKDKEIEKLTQDKKELMNELTKQDENIASLTSQNNKLQEEIKELNEKLQKTTTLLKKIYNIIPKK